MAGHVSSRPTTLKQDAVFDKESVATTVFSSPSKGKRDRHTNVVQSLKDREQIQQILERKVGSAARVERIAQQKRYEAEAEVEARNWEEKS